MTDEEYDKFYQDTSLHDFDKPQRVITASVEGAVTYKALLFIPVAAADGLLQRGL